MVYLLVTFFYNINYTSFYFLFQSGKLSHEVNFMSKEIRDKLNELKKQEINRLQKIVLVKSDLENGELKFTGF